MYIYIYIYIHSGINRINETKQRELELLVSCLLGMTTNCNTNHQIMKMKTELNRSKNLSNSIGKYVLLLI